MKNILYMSLVDWFWIKQRPQHFAELLSKSNKVTYLSRRRWKNDKNSVFMHSENDTRVNSKKFKLNNNMFIVRQRLIPRDIKIKLIGKLNSLIMKTIVLSLERKNKYDVILMTHPSQVDYVPDSFFNSKVIVYDCMDNYSEFNGFDKKMLLTNERKLIEKCNFIIVSSLDLKRILIKRYNSYDSIENKITIINNGVDISTFSLNNPNLDDNIEILLSDKKKVGYIGTVTHWLDMDLIKKVALKNSNIEFYFIGPIGDELDISQYKDINNIIFTGTQPYYKVPSLLNKLDIAIMPFIMNDLINSVNPVKIYEYLAMSKPVIAVRYEETTNMGDLIYTYETENEFNIALEMALNENKVVNPKRIKFAEENTWQKRVNALLELIQ